MLRTMHHRGPDGAGYVIGSNVDRRGRLEDLDFKNKRGRAALGHVRLAITGQASGLQPFQSQDRRVSFLHNGEIYNYQQLWAELESANNAPPRSDSEVVMRLLEQHYAGDLKEAVTRILPRLDGVYALAISDQKQTLVVRDRIGVRQLYYSKNGDRLAFASEKKPLWELFGRAAEINRILPGHLLAMDAQGSEMLRFWSPEQLRNEPMITNRDDALSVYGGAMRAAIQKRIHGRDRVGIIFSGGIDSVLVAYLVREAGVPFTCYTVGCGENAPDLIWARDVAKRLGFPLQEKVLTAAEVESLIPEIIRDIEDHSLNQVEVAVPIYIANRLAQEAGERVLLTGQGADELFGGYSWYSRVAAESYDNFVARSWEDTCLLYKECLEREDKITMAHSMELRVPFLDPEVIRAAFRIAPELKVNQGEDLLGKRIHRDFCHAIGIPEDIAFRVKEAAQHGANVHDTLGTLADQRTPDEATLGAAGYDPDKSVTEKLGSSSRYGYRYGDAQLWKPAPRMQFLLDSHAARLGLLPPDAQRHWEEVNQRLAGEPVLTSPAT
ncbi:MAG: asparagine synthetase B [Verrucomicrobia bacterium]|nr:asparagine synthetase B [Verrucomicrobiota bacterium]